MANAELNPRDWRDVQVLCAQGVLAEFHTVDLDQADRGLRGYAAMTGVSLHTVARQVVDRELRRHLWRKRGRERPGADVHHHYDHAGTTPRTTARPWVRS